MLRRFQIARLAFQHSPEREQRLLSFATDPTNTNPEGKERIEQPAEKPELKDPVDSLSSQLGEKLKEAVPQEILGQLHKKEDAFIEILSATGGISELVARVTKECGIEETPDDKDPLPGTSGEKRAQFIDRLLGEASDEEIIRLLTAARGLIDLDEERMRSIERNLKPIIAHTNDPALLEQTLEQLYRYETIDEGQKLDGELKQDLLGPENIVEKTGLEGAFSEDDRRRLFEALKEIARSNRIRRALGQRIHPQVSREGQSAARQKFLETAQQSIDILSEYADRKINARAEKLIERCDEIATSFSGTNEEIFLKHGITAESIEDALAGGIVTLKKIRRELDENNRPKPGEPRYAEELTKALNNITRYEEILATEDGKKLPKILEAKKIEETNAQTWAFEMGRQMWEIDEEALREAGATGTEVIQELRRFFEPFRQSNTASTQDLMSIRRTSASEQRNITATIEMARTNPRGLDGMDAEPQESARLVDDIDGIRGELRGKLDAALGGIVTIVDGQPVCAALGMQGRIETLKKGIDLDLQTGVSSAMESAKKKIEVLERCGTLLSLVMDDRSVVPVDDEDEYRKLTGADSDGWYSYKDGKIFINEKKIERTGRDRREVIAHEKGHAVIDAFRRSGVFPNLLIDLYESLDSATKDTGESFESLLLAQAKGWGIPIANPEHLTNAERWKLVDELTNCYAEWKAAGGPPVDADLLKLFRLYQHTRESVEPTEQLELTGGVHSMGGEEMDPLGEYADAAPTAVALEEEDIKVDSLIEGMDKHLLDCDEFLKAYPQYANAAKEEFEYPEVKRLYKDLRADFKSGAYLRNPKFYTQLKALNGIVKEFLDAIRKIDVEKSDLTYVRKENVRTLWQRISEDVNWVNLPDLWVMVKDAGSDVARMWKRRSEAHRNNLGKSLSELIPKEVPYLGRLRYDFERRDRDSEEEEVGVWEKGLDKVDSHVLQHDMLPHVRSRDQLKGIIRLLAKRGRLDWDDIHLWHKLEYHSGFKMPHEACRRNSILRNQWLQKMIADIWRDTDLFEHWKAENDGAIESGRKHVDPYVEDLSAGGSLRTELRKLLFNFTKLKRGQPIAKEEEVNPHLYEGIIFYAMRNGKMSMEEKFFYLVKGVQIGLLSVDRLRTFSGENFGILNSFPFIDFFSAGQNCTMHEIEAIASQITETEDDEFKPGARMTKFLMERVSFDKNVYDRVNKGLKRAENIDHEDIPMLLTQVDYAGVNQIVNFTSGSQAKVSAQAMMNGYVGYNSYLKYFGMKAAIGHPPITERDIAKIATTLGAYSMWDNLITRNSIGADTSVQRPFLSWQQINDQAPVSGDQKTKVYRDKMNAFTVELCQSIGIQQVKGIDIDDFIGIRRNSRTAEELKAKYGKEPGAIYKTMEGSPQHLVDQLMEKLKEKGNRDKLTEILRKHEALFIPEREDFHLSNVRKFWSNGAPSAPAHGHGH